MYINRKKRENRLEREREKRKEDWKKRSNLIKIYLPIELFLNVRNLCLYLVAS